VICFAAKVRQAQDTGQPYPIRYHAAIYRYHLAICVLCRYTLLTLKILLRGEPAVHELTLSILGAFQATLNNEPVKNFRSVKIQGLLIYLACTPWQAHSRAELATLLWPDEPETPAKQNLRISLHRLRQLLGDIDLPEATSPPAQGEPYLLVTRSTVQFNPNSPFHLDAAEFLRALATDEWEKAASLYQGDLLPDFTCDSPPFEAWLRIERERYHRLALDALFKLTAQCLAMADYHTAHAYAEQQLSLEPWREEAHRQLMQALALRGERSAAIAQYETCRAVLTEELGIEPGPETQALLIRIRSRNHAPANAPIPSSSSRQFTIPFVGREAEVATLVQAYHQCVNNGLQVVTLSGNAGIGKTCLTEHFLAWVAMQGADVLHSRAFETSGGLSYQPLTELMRQRLEQENAPEDLLSDFWLSQLTRLLPELRDRYPDLPAPTQDANVGQEHLFEAITRLILALAARQPLLIAIDDWHWADSASRDALHYAILRWSKEELPIMLLLGLRQEAVAETPDVRQWLARLNHSISVLPMRLEALTQTETEQLIQRLLESATDDAGRLAKFSDWLFAESGGQPLFLAEMLKALVAEDLVRPDEATMRWHLDGDRFEQARAEGNGHIAAGIQQIIKGWLVRISPTANKLLTAAAILTHAVSFDQLLNVAEVDESEALRALDELLSRQLLQETGGDALSSRHEPTYTFSHQKVGEVVYLEAGAARRRIFHRRAFATRKAEGAAAADLVHHAIHAGLLAETIYYSLIAGNEALNVLAARIAVNHYESAFQSAAQHGWPERISGADRLALYTGLGRAYELCEKAEQARSVYEEMVAYARQTGATGMECVGLNRLAELYGMALFDLDKAFAVLEQAWAVAERTGDRRGMAETAQNLSGVAGLCHDIDNELRYAQQALALARELEHPQLSANCLRRLAYVYPGLREWELFERYAHEAKEHFEAIGNLMLANDVQRLLGASQMQNGRPQESSETLKQAFAFIQQVENDWEQADVARFLALVHAELGQYGQAIQLVSEAVDKARKVNHPMITIPLSAAQVVYRAALALDASQEAGLAIVEAFDNGGFDPFPDLALAELCAVHALRGEWDEAYGYAKKVLAFHAGGSLSPMGLTGWYETEALLRGGDGELARAEVARVASTIKSVRYRLPLLRSQAVLAEWDGNVAHAIMHLEAALALAQEIGLPGEEWMILGELGRLYAEQEDREKAQEAYKEAGTIIHHLAETLHDETLREGFLTAALDRSVTAREK
jgi:DNA-binding SARP family transcriptional activator